MSVPASIIAQVAKAAGIGERDILSPCRLPHIVRARWSVMLALRRGGASFPVIGALLGRDHKTVMHGVSRANALMVSDAGFQSLCAEILA